MQQGLEISGTVKVQRLTPIFVQEHWDELEKYVAEMPLLPTGYRTPAQLNVALANILAGHSTLWLAFDEKGNILLCVLCTKELLGASGTQVMSIDGLKEFAHAGADVFKMFNEALEDYARRCGCIGLTAETDSTHVADLAKFLGWKATKIIKLYKEFA